MRWRCVTHTPWIPFCLWLALSGAARAEDAISTDRPDFVESSLTVGKGRFQIETSVAKEYDKDGPLQVTTLATATLLRLGIAADWELRLETVGYARQQQTDATVPIDETRSGMTDVAVGVKWHTQDGEGARPS